MNIYNTMRSTLRCANWVSVEHGRVHDPTVNIFTGGILQILCWIPLASSFLMDEMANQIQGKVR